MGKSRVTTSMIDQEAALAMGAKSAAADMAYAMARYQARNGETIRRLVDVSLSRAHGKTLGALALNKRHLMNGVRV